VRLREAGGSIDDVVMVKMLARAIAARNAEVKTHEMALRTRRLSPRRADGATGACLQAMAEALAPEILEARGAQRVRPATDGGDRKSRCQDVTVKLADLDITKGGGQRRRLNRRIGD
jgi:hypothetical protein